MYYKSVVKYIVGENYSVSKNKKIDITKRGSEKLNISLPSPLFTLDFVRNNYLSTSAYSRHIN